MQITTPRLTLVAPNAKQLRDASLKPRKIATIIGKTTPQHDNWCYYRNKGAIYAEKARLMKLDPDNWLLATAWQLCLDGVVIGECGFKGVRLDVRHFNLELGYALRKHYHGHGYMTEAVTALCKFAFENYPEIAAITARTKRRNIASQSVLRRCGFVSVERWGWYRCWELTTP